MPLTEKVIVKALRDAGKELKKDLWKPGDEAFLAARAKDLVGLNAKALAATSKAKKKAYVAAARDVVNHAKLFALIRAEAAAAHIADALGRFFLEKLLPVLVRLLPALVGL